MALWRPHSGRSQTGGTSICGGSRMWSSAQAPGFDFRRAALVPQVIQRDVDDVSPTVGRPSRRPSRTSKGSGGDERRIVMGHPALPRRQAGRGPGETVVQASGRPRLTAVVVLGAVGFVLSCLGHIGNLLLASALSVPGRWRSLLSGRSQTARRES